MKIGILTFHSQLNYGGVLQCWALQTVLERMGHEVVVIDREFEHQIRSIKGIFKDWSVKEFIKFLVKLVALRPDALRVFRYARTVSFVRKHLHLTPYSFKSWDAAPKELGVDCIVVGSDQVWNGTWNDLGVYTLDGAPPTIPAIGYAISLGMTQLPENKVETYRKAADRFSTVTVREKEARELLAPMGIVAKHVADPVVLMDWTQRRNEQNMGLVCYFIGKEFAETNVAQTLLDFHRKSGVQVNVFFQNYPKKWPLFSGIKAHYAAGPNEFLNALASARYIISDSFHALMFACKFGKNVRIIRPPSQGLRQQMFSRIDEFVNKYGDNSCVAGSVNDALVSLDSGMESHFAMERINQFACESRAVLVSALEKTI